MSQLSGVPTRKQLALLLAGHGRHGMPCADSSIPVSVARPRAADLHWIARKRRQLLKPIKRIGIAGHLDEADRGRPVVNPDGNDRVLAVPDPEKPKDRARDPRRR